MSAQAGIYYRDRRPVAPEVVDILTAPNRAHGPDASGIHTAPGLAMLAFASHFDSLAIDERQPIRTEAGGALTWDGRLDNRDDFLVRLSGCLADDRSDARLLAVALDRWGDEALQLATGDWTLVRWNAREHVLLIARDYTGNRLIHYCIRPDYFVWSTALDAIVDFCDLAGTVSDAYIAGALTFGPPAHHTLYPGVFTAPPGCALILRSDWSLVKRRVKHLMPPRTLSYRHASQYEEEYRSLLTEAVKVRLRARTVVTAELSGGYDSSSIVCLASSLIRSGSVEATRLQPLTVVPASSPESAETEFVRCVDQYCGLTSLALPHSDESVSDTLAVDEPDAHPDRQHVVSTAAAAHNIGSRVLLTGHLGDAITAPSGIEEVLAHRVRTYHPVRFIRDSIQHCRATKETLLTVWMTSLSEALTPPYGLSRSCDIALRELAKAQGLRTRAIADVYGLRGDFVARALPPLEDGPPLLDDVPSYRRGFVNALENFVGRGILSGLRDSPQVRATHPFSHAPLVLFILSIPLDAMWAPEYPRAFVCRALADVLPDRIITRRTKGHASPAVARTRVALAEKALQELDTWELVKRGYAEPESLSALFQKFLNGAGFAVSRVGGFVQMERRLRSSMKKRRSIARAADPPSLAVGSS